MRVNVTVSKTGRFKHTMSQARRARRVKNVQYGFLEPVIHPRSKRLMVDIAMDNEFGKSVPEKNINVPERPFWRPGVRKAAAVTRELSGRVDPATLTMSRRLAQRIGIASVNVIKAEIEGVRTPPNAPFTIARKGFDDPLIETRTLVDRSITYRVGAASPAGTRPSAGSDVFSAAGAGFREVGQAFARVLGIGGR